MTICHLQAFQMVIYSDRRPRVARKWWRGEGSAGSMAERLEDEHTFKRGYLRSRLSLYQFPG